ncbi:alpha/beta hydrolase family protein [Streptomyces sp. MP131-18]|uniref:alpha/beta hydrolase n=1 Tax=Streptomyces sp. MP131-18 TaxID=1857892 RepID=UPI00097BE075|nr:alpha/beta hydrolase family protein [Streptomyces sp. MP131-18]ONK11695.1 acetoin dehydrogenase E2 subunit dihydrolipoyllysine-residue acetyltransferase [Streptomyces sp. MP131-18]
MATQGNENVRKTEKSGGFGRRAWLRSAGLAGGAAVLSAGAGAGIAGAGDGAQDRGRDRRPTTFVLVHGTHSGGVFWAPFARELQLRGHRAIAVDQPYHGAGAFVPESYQRQDLAAMATEPSPLADVTLDDFERNVTRAVRRAARHGRVVLIGHSMGGLSVSRVAEAVPELIDHIAYMASFCPSPAMPTLTDCMSSPEAASAVSPDAQMIGDLEELGVIRMNWRTGDAHDLDVFKEMICADHSDAAFRTIIGDLQTDESVRVTLDPAVGTAHRWGRIPRSYFLFGRDRMITPELQKRMIREADERTPGNPFAVHDFDASHIGPPDPAPVVDVMDRLAR